MRVVNLSSEDTAGIGWALAGAFTRHTDWEYFSGARRTNWICYPEHTPWDQAARIAHTADVIHVNNNFATARSVGVTHKPMVIHHHGTQFRRDPEAKLTEQRTYGAAGITSTLDLWLLAPNETTWVPTPVDVDRLAAIRTPIANGKIRVGHAPTNRAVKNTEAFLDAAAKHPLIEVVLIERQPWTDCLRLKATCDVYFDQVELGYGSNALEAWAMGIPVIAGAQPATIREYLHRFGCVPFLQAGPDTIADALQVMLNPDTRASWATLGSRHVSEVHHEQHVVDQLAQVYRKTQQ